MRMLRSDNEGLQPASRQMGRRAIAAIAILLLTAPLCLLLAEQLLHWAILPILACGFLVLTLPFRQKAFHPGSLLVVLGFHFFFAAPILEIISERGMNFVEPPSDWRPWLGWMATINAIGLLLFRWGLNAKHLTRTRSVWTLDERYFLKTLVPWLIITGILQIAVYWRTGGISGYVETFEARDGGFSGLGAVFMFSESFPILLLMGYAVLARSRPSLRSLVAIGFALLIFFLIKILFGGLRGSRSNTIWGLFWAAGIIHLYVRRLPRIAFAIGISATIGFMFIYGFYKSGGTQSVASLVESGGIEDESPLGRDFSTLLLGDLGRANVQAFLLYRLQTFPDRYDYSFGRTYAGALALLVPKSIWPRRPPTKIVEGTEALYGKGAFEAGITSSRVYGLGGEAMLNFSPLGVPLAYLAYGIIFGILLGKLHSLGSGDSRWLLVPFVSLFLVLLLSSDSDNIVFFSIKNGALPFGLVWWCSKKRLHIEDSRPGSMGILA